jgi:hypothetical protein
MKSEHLLVTGSHTIITTSEAVVTITIWVLTGAGIFFGSRAVLRRRKEKRSKEQK